MKQLQSVAVFGSTGSIGISTIDVLQHNAQQFRVAALTANSNVELLYRQCIDLQPDFAAMATTGAASELAVRLKRAAIATQVVQGDGALEQLASDPAIPVVMAAIVGFAGLAPTLAAAVAGKKILLANKESMVVAGDMLVDAARRGGASIVPVDSEHNAIFQCLPNGYSGFSGADGLTGITSLVLTASGGPFRDWSLERMCKATVTEAVAHPNWSMGDKISVDSATMMNKGLEIIEACYLFAVEENHIEVLVHPQSVVHSMVRYRDGSVLAQMGQPDMRTPIAHALAWPERIESGVEPLDFKLLGGLHFEAPDLQRFPCLELAREAMRRGNGANGVLNAANEVAVEQFLAGRIGFCDISLVNEKTLSNRVDTKLSSIEDLYSLDRAARQFATDFIDSGLQLAELS